MRRSHLVLGPLTLLLALTLTGCGSGSSDGTAASKSGPVAHDSAAGPDADGAAFVRSDEQVQARAVVSTGGIDLVSRDVAGARDDVDTLLARYDGFLADERTSTDDHGTTTSARLVLRVPSERFDVVMTALTRVGRLQHSSRKAEDVTTQVIDVHQRLRAQQVGLHRLEVLLAKATSLRDLLRIEREVTRRQADVDSLTSQRAYLAGQTTLATISLRIDRTPRPAVHSDTGFGAGFGAGLAAGWHGLTTFVTGTLTAVGALLPFTLLVLVLAPLGWLLRRALRRRRLVAEPVQPTG